MGELVATECKIHLATHNGVEDPLDVYLSGAFNKWQRHQTRRNFERKFVISLIALRPSNSWLFAGVHSSGPVVSREDDTFHYPLVEKDECKELNGRLIVHFKRPSRQAYLNAEQWADSLRVTELRPSRLTIAQFPGFKLVHLTKNQLDLIVREQLPEWRSALSSVAGVYLITDSETGKKYVGSATGQGGIWNRWCAYSSTGHGGNVEIKQMMEDLGSDHARNLRYSILEIADTHASSSEVLQRESHWKDVLLTRKHGLNAN
ncbi:GIY-YIG nuclease family protein [Methyloversatilis universalis]|uniref:GIY-YIG nuclease family protein n=1 Tax=Methyloversatilis universalis TaxID=378211 RepID=UPI0018DEDD93|nr:GIY-YIG nuclease family protein [Methyloversatilis universalis]